MVLLPPKAEPEIWDAQLYDGWSPDHQRGQLPSGRLSISQRPGHPASGSFGVHAPFRLCNRPSDWL